ncbi:MAG: hypothetical protein N0C80_12460, partial [Candidatus Thiodiazotropha endolucinida]|nr:hypothetical protein [Candidatus Thiodiazotropha taylori]MCW4271721.1 hypothetical protein [Candidatus Thiodiazotropha endolucinida]
MNDGILGMDFLKTHKCDLVLLRQVIKVNGESILCFPNSRMAQPQCCRVAILEPVEIPPQTEVIVPGYTKGVINKKGTGLIEADVKFLHNKGLLVAKALVCPTTGIVPLRVANPHSSSCKLYKNTIVASYEPIEPEQLVSVNTTTQSHDTEENDFSDDFPDHLKELYVKSSEKLTSEQQSRLRRLLINYQNQ